MSKPRRTIIMSRQVLERMRRVCERDGVTMQQLLQLGAERLIADHPLPPPPSPEMRLVIRRREDAALRAPAPRGDVFTF